jgi:AcrR family transcriptional regulator
MPKIPTRQRIFEEAARLFQEQGYKATTMRDLAKRVEITVSSLYSHIGGKEEILQKICFDNARNFLETLKEVEALAASPKEKVERLIAHHIRVAVNDVTSVTIFNDEWRHLSEPYLVEFLSVRKDYERRFARIIQQGMEAGQFVSLNPTIALFTILTSIRWLHRWYPEKKGISLKALEQDILKILFFGLYKQEVV